MPLALRPVAWAALALLQGAAWAQADTAPLRTSPRLEEPVSEAQRRQTPTFVSGERISGQQDLVTVVEGDAELRRADTVIRADRLEYHQPEDLAKARGHVRINRAGDLFQGPELELYVDAFEGFFLQPTYQLLRNQAHGEASRVDFAGEKRAIVHQASYTTCLREPGPSWMPDWILRADRITFDQEAEVGQAEGALLSFKGLPLLPIPSMSFPLSDRRKSGVLPPTFGIDSVSGLELSLPYYWDIAPNRDATFTPTLMSKRGVDLASEFRYLENDYKGQARVNLMPSDRLRDRDRWGYSLQHQGSVQTGWSRVGALGLNLNLNRVSDDNYWRDFPRAGLTLTQRLLPSDGSLAWARGDFSFNARALKWQTLQDVTAPIVPPYDRMPQLAARYARFNIGGFDYSVDADTTRFEADFSRLAPSLRPVQPNGQRSFLLAQLSRPWLRSWGFLTPKLQLHARNYQFDAALANGATTASRTLPTFSLDSGLVFERDASFFGRALRQTLEPRAFYVRTPFRDQSLLPNYDSGANDFNFATIYTENAFVGHDRIADNNLLTMGVTTRLLDPETGAEAARFGLAQRFRFSDQNVTLPGGTPVSERLSDVLLGAALNWDPRWGFDGTVQYNPKTHRSIRTTLGARYLPGPYRVLNLAYRLQRGTSEQIDFGWQWPLSSLSSLGGDSGEKRSGGRWYSVGRLNYSLQDRKLVDAILGVEYDACCWIGRVVLERLQSTTTTANTRILFQLEFVGFSRIGSSPLKTLRDNIRGYQELRSQSTAPSRFSNYD
ncbi:LPS-assembly protein LptD [Ramlibacter sp. 2FC]|uniref:LPS-assembly protein LptD n=1 Tax=Ramlibacter sp. 2FC TaxID=2502188 RepID=UPI00201DD396|nr:LPS-assembly protein LptD [Ramlibacter sp. 2FC]